ncbi:MAG: CTP synthase, partial [Candidatus Paceibacterota bacterium]
MDINTNGTKYIFVVGGVMSGVGKGITTASIATILESSGYKVSPIKVDPYLNVDAGTMNPTEHGEVFVLDSGLETDQDMGNYERFLDRSLPGLNYMTNGMVFQYVINKERALGYDGKCVEPTYHITEEIIRRITESSRETEADITIVEIGGTIGEYQNAIFIEAARRMKRALPGQVMFTMVSYLPTPPSIGEMKTKPTQNAVRQLNSYGVAPDMIIGRAETPLDDKRKEKIANMCGVTADNVISAPDIDSIYEVPLNFAADNIGGKILSFFGMDAPDKDLAEWRDFVAKQKAASKPVKIAVVGKYFATGDFQLSDAYISVIEALKIAAAHADVVPDVDWINTDEFEGDTAASALEKLSEYDGLIVPGGFGTTGIEGKIAVINYAREQKLPYFGLCYGMQLAVVEYARSVLGLAGAHTVEINPDTPDPVIAVMADQEEKLAAGEYGGTMRLGSYPAVLTEGTIAHEAYGRKEVSERHRHRFEVNNDYVERLEAAGLVFSGRSPDGRLMEITELPRDVHPFFLGTQFHPEFTARVLSSQPLFDAFIKAC